jgi:acetyl-CoA acetyltransferase
MKGAAMRDVVIAGVGMTQFGKLPDRSLKSLTSEAVDEALADAHADPEEAEFVYFSNVAGGRLQEQDAIRGQVWLSDSVLAGVPLVNVENACASGSTAVHQAWLSVASGAVDVAVAVGAEKLHVPDKARAFKAMTSGVDQDRLEEFASLLGGDSTSRSMFMDIYARFALDNMERTGATREDFARVSVKNHGHGALNPKAHYGVSLTLEDVLSAREISGPLTLPMCAPMGDGAAVGIITTPERAHAWGAEPVRLLGVAIGSGKVGTAEGRLVTETARRAYERAGITPVDVDVVECHDATAPAELIVMEQLGLCAEGEAPKLLLAGETTLGGRLPVNPSGGLESKGHPLGATGIAQLVELADQLRHRCGDRQIANLRIALAENAGGYLGPDAAAAAVVILGSI